MLQLSRNPVQGGSVIIRVVFKDESGRIYVPTGGYIYFTLCALHREEGTWEVVNGRNKVAVPAGSTVDIVLQGLDLEVLGGCALKRRLIVDWEYLRNGEKVSGRDMADFEVVPLPVFDPVPPPPPPLEPPSFYVREFWMKSFADPVQVGVLFSNPADTNSVVEGSVFLEDSEGGQVFGVRVDWSGDRLVAYLVSMVPVPVPVTGGLYIRLSKNILSEAGVPLSGEGQDGGYVRFSVSFPGTAYIDSVIESRLSDLQRQIDEINAG
jgi:hypothetical protein